MKHHPRESARISEDPIDTDVENLSFSSPPPKRKKGDKYFTDQDCINFQNLLPRLPELRHVRGAKERIQFWAFKTIDETVQEIFAKNKTVFRYESQIHMLAHYIGVKILEEGYLSLNGIPKSKLSEILEAQEPQYKVYDLLKTIKENVQGLIEKHYQGFMTRDELDGHIALFCDVVQDHNSRGKLQLIIDDLLDTHEIGKTKDRIRKRNERIADAEKRGIKKV